jgi:hypothetical protein
MAFADQSEVGSAPAMKLLQREPEAGHGGRAVDIGRPALDQPENGSTFSE